MKKIVHVISSIDLSSGGPSKSASELCIFLAELGVDVSLVTMKTTNPYITDLSCKKVNLHFVAQRFLVGGISIQLTIKKFVKERVGIFHGHGLWQMPVHYMCCVSRRKKIPYIISPRGMLEPWSLNNNKFKKQIACILYQRRDLMLARCLHATSVEEAENVRRLGYQNPIAIIPNGIVLEDYPYKNAREYLETRKVLFLSRIDPKKGIEILIQAWAALSINIRQSWNLEIAGGGDPKYVSRLQQQVMDLELQNEIHFIGPQFGDEKILTYHQADLFVLPTYSENFGIVIIEAMACGLPVITTKGTPWEELVSHNAGWWIDIGVEPLKVALEKALLLDDFERQTLGANGRELVSRKYSTSKVANEMLCVYEWMLCGGNPPSCVMMN